MDLGQYSKIWISGKQQHGLGILQVGCTSD